MMTAMKTKLYLDTSIPSAYFDFSKPARQLITQQWFKHEAQKYSLYISVITIEEIDQFKNIPKRDNIRQLLLDHNAKVLELGDDATKIANEYLKRGAIPKSEPEDALHIAIATVNKMDALASWNFKHIVSMAPIRKIHGINKKQNYAIIEIGSLEIFGGSQYGNL